MFKNKGPCKKVSVKAVTKALNLMKTKKAAGQSGTTFEWQKVCKNDSVKKLAKVAKDSLQKKCLKVVKESDLIPICEKKEI